MISLITCTGARPEAFALCNWWMRRQTYTGSVQWIVVNDCDPTTEEKIMPVLSGWKVKYVFPRPSWKPGQNTQARNMLAGLRHVEGDQVFIIEDDDWYSPEYLQVMTTLLTFSEANIVGEAMAKYYSLPDRTYSYMQNGTHASLCQTGFKKSMIPLMVAAIESGELYFDIELWRMVREGQIKSCLTTESLHCVGIKGMPGRGGIGIGHQLKKLEFAYEDSDLLVIKQWLGDDWSCYKDYLYR